MKYTRKTKGILGYIVMWLMMIVVVVFMPVLSLFKYSVVLEAERNNY